MKTHKKQKQKCDFHKKVAFFLFLRIKNTTKHLIFSFFCFISKNKCTFTPKKQPKL